jgi:hypothetical protein
LLDHLAVIVFRERVMLAAMSRLRPSRRDRGAGSRRRSRAGLAALAFLFAVGASFGGAYGASAEDGVGTTGTTTAATTEATTTVDTPTVTESPTVDTQTDTASPTPEPAPGQETGGGSGPGPSPEPALPTPDPPASPSGSSVEPPTSGGAAGGSSAAGSGGNGVSTPYVLAPASTLAEGYATTWLHGVLPDPTPPARRLAPAYARLLKQTARRAKVDWALLHAVVRARGHHGRMPSSPAALHRLAGELRRVGARADAERAVVRLGGAEFGQRVLALRNYNRAVGLKALVIGLERAKPGLERRLLRDRRVQIYTSGRNDLASGRIDVRVTVLIRYLAVSFHQVTVSSLLSGHRLFARPGVVSAHIYGHAVDVSALGGLPIGGNQGLGSITEAAVERILRLPAELEPRQVISLLGFGGPSFALADHFDHIHIGY